MAKPPDLKGKWALVTGASAGLGALFARQLAARGMNVVLVARRLERLEALGRELRQEHGIEVVELSVDLSLPGAALRVFEQSEGAGRPIAVLINNAGFGLRKAFVEIPPDRIEAQIQLNVTAVTALARLFAEPMIQRHEGYILNIASIQGQFSVPYYATYCGTKAFVVSFSEALRYELRGSGVTVACSCPGTTETEFLEIASHTDLSPMLKILVMKAEPVVSASLKTLFGGGGVVVTGWKNRVVVGSLALLPRSLRVQVVGRLIGPGAAK